MTSQQRNCRVAITGCDYFCGHEMARHLLENHKEHENCRIVCMGAHVDRMRDLERQGGEIVKTNPDDVKCMEETFRECDWVVLEAIPEHNRVELSRRMLEAAKKADVKNVILMSCAAADANEKLKHLHEFCEIEREFKRCNFNWNCVVRVEFVQNWFHAWAQPVEDKGQFPLSVGQDRKFAPIRIEDVCCAVRDLMCGDESNRGIPSAMGNNKHNKQTYTLTGPEAVTGHKIVDELNNVIQGRVSYQDVDRNQMEKILRSLRDRDQQRPQCSEETEDRRRYFEGQPTDCQINTLLDYFDYVKQGKAERTTDDLRKITGRDGQRIERFFKDNAAEFRPRRQV